MSRFYGTMKGAAKNPVTARGHQTGGITMSAQTFNGSVIMKLFDVGGEDHLIIAAAEGSESNIEKATAIFRGPIKSLASLDGRKALMTEIARQALTGPTEEA